MSKGWTEERRQKQAEMIRRWKPWEKSTGPKTSAGKERCRMNACKDHSIHEAKKLLRLNYAFLQQLKVYQAAAFKYDK
jgi:hypothetical protein